MHVGVSSACLMPGTSSSGLSHDNTWIGLNDRTVEDDFQWTDKMDLVRVAVICDPVFYCYHELEIFLAYLSQTGQNKTKKVDFDQ